MGDVLRAAAEAAWKTDPGFQVIAKYLYGSDVVLDDVLDDIAKMDPASADVHVPGQGCKCAKCKKVEKWDKNQARDNASGKFISGGKHALRTTAEVAGAGVLGGLAAGATLKAPGMAQNAARGVRGAYHGVDHISSALKDTAKVTGLAGGGLVAGVAAQENAQSAHKDIKAILRRRKANVEETAKRMSDGTQRRVAEGLSVTGAAAGAGGLAYAAHDAVNAARLGRKMPLKTKALIPLEVAGLGGEVLSAHKFHQDLKKPKIPTTKPAVVKMLGEAVAKNLITPEQAYEVAKDWSKWNEERKAHHQENKKINQGIRREAWSGKEGRQKYTQDPEFKDHHHKALAGILGGEVGIYGGGMAVGHAMVTDQDAKVHEALRHRDTELARHHTALAHESILDHGAPDIARASEHPGFEHAVEAKNASERAAQHGEDAARAAKTSLRTGRAGVAAMAVGAGALGYGIHEARQRDKRAQEIYRSGKKVVAAKAYDEDEHEVTWEGEFSKIDDDKRQVFGWASVTEIDGRPVVDLQGDYIHPTEMERAAYDYVLKSRVGGDMHSRVDERGNKIEKADKALHVSDMIESMVFTPEKVEKLGLPEGSLPTGWWVGFKVNDEDVWKSVKDGGRKGFSIHGLGARMEKRLDEIGKSAVETLIEKAYEYSETVEEFAENLSDIYDRTGMEIFKHLEHGIHHDPMQQQTVATGNKTAIGAGVGAGVGSAVGTLAGLATGKAHGSTAGSAIGTLAGTAGGAAIGHQIKAKPVRPPSLAHLPPVAAPEVKKPVVKLYTEHRDATPEELSGVQRQFKQNHPIKARLTGRKRDYSHGVTAADDDGNTYTIPGMTAPPGPSKKVKQFSSSVGTFGKAVTADDYFEKSVGTSNRTGSTGQRQEAYTNHYLQQATQMMAPQVAQHIQQLQQQQQMQQMMEQQALQNAPQQQNWQTLSQMGPQGPQGPSGPQQGQQGPTGPVTYQQ